MDETLIEIQPEAQRSQDFAKQQCDILSDDYVVPIDPKVNWGTRHFTGGDTRGSKDRCFKWEAKPVTHATKQLVPVA